MDTASGKVFWITGLSGVGKSTLARIIYEALCNAGRNPIILDGDDIRKLLLTEPLFDRESRLVTARFNARLCHFLSKRGLDVVCATISLFHEVQEWNRNNMDGYTEIFLDSPLSVLKNRDKKKIYDLGPDSQIKNVVGVDIEAEWPKCPDFKFITDGRITPEQIAKAILC